MREIYPAFDGQIGSMYIWVLVQMRFVKYNEVIVISEWIPEIETVIDILYYIIIITYIIVFTPLRYYSNL